MAAAAARRREPTLFGFDFSFAPPIVERGEYLPGEPGVPKTAREFWAYVDALSDDEDLGAASFLETAHRRHFYFGIADGVKAGFMHFRQCDARLNARAGARPRAPMTRSARRRSPRRASRACACSIGSTARSRSGRWTRCPNSGSAVVEIYTRIYLRRAGMSGTKLRSRADLNRALKGLGSPPARLRFEPNDHQTDALVTAAGMRALATRSRAPSNPKA